MSGVPSAVEQVRARVGEDRAAIAGDAPSAWLWEVVDAAVEGRGLVSSADPVPLCQLAWLTCRAVWAADASPVFSESAGRLAGFPGAADTAMSRLVRRHTPPTEAAVAAVADECAVSLPVVAATAAALTAATALELPELTGLSDSEVRDLLCPPSSR